MPAIASRQRRCSTESRPNGTIGTLVPFTPLLTVIDRCYAHGSRTKPI